MSAEACQYQTSTNYRGGRLSKKKTETETPIRSIEEFRQRYFSESYLKELRDKEKEDDDPAGVGLITELLEELRRDLAAQKKRREHRAGGCPPSS